MSLKPIQKLFLQCLGPSRSSKTGDLSDIPTRKTADELEWEQRQKFVVEIPKNAFRFYLEVKMQGQSHLVEMWSFDKVFDIKAQIMIHHKIPFESIVVLKGNTFLEDDQTLEHYGIGVNGTVQIRIRPDFRKRKARNIIYCD
ncbi:Protein CBG26939 [Caenorhabditis briggsae]|uniref:Ubiquitin-like domain-containing protein n=2 Tax=Caenorhabditis briggsae TaxID=6238 RepID=A0AAE8ZXQ2_CAEBR|nr:Protein CBG26939 [Caenorhabditis briggsae]ULT86876.1 hypothetical protein L3Y34_006540 [Caenorhabditis briggsae]UMM32620.1 hypothetical protein L5515_006348 [Caenorhabditis briggsae]CAS00956.1 Protein CBG26939 [Caenorhabditis briggsae]